MRYVPIVKVESGMVLGQSIYNVDGKLMLARHVILNQEFILNLQNQGYPGIYVDDEFTDGIEIQEIISPEVRREAVKNVHDLFLKQDHKNDAAQEEISIKQCVMSVVDEILANGDVMCNMLDLKTYDGYTYFHSVNVAVLSAMMGAQIGMNRKELEILTTAAMLHDIGKKFLPIDVLNAPRKLTEEEFQILTQHPKLGFDFLRNTYDFPSLTYLSVLEHHEWYDGNGYPLQKKGDEIPVSARIIKITDVYDAMTSKRPYHDPALPSDVVEYIMGRSGMEFCPEMVSLFLSKIAVYPVGCEVELSNGERGIVVENFKEFVLRPKIKIMGTGEIRNLRDDRDARNIIITKLLM